MHGIDLNDLSNDQVKELINELKYPETDIDVTKLKTLIACQINERQDIVSFRLGIKYIITIKRGNIEIDRFSISIIFQDTHHTLVRLDVKGGTHNNPDGTTAPNTHIHIYNNSYDKKDRFAYEINLQEFPNIYEIYNAYMAFLDYTNVKELS